MHGDRFSQLDADLTSDVDASSSRDVLTVEGTRAGVHAELAKSVHRLQGCVWGASLGLREC